VRYSLLGHKHDGTTGAVMQLTDLSDVNTATPTNQNFLIADGTDWESRALVEADISDLSDYLIRTVDESVSGSYTFTNTAPTAADPTLGLSAANPMLTFYETDQAVDEKLWSLQVSGSEFGGWIYEDAGGNTNRSQWLAVNRTDYSTVDSIELLSDDLQYTGALGQYNGTTRFSTATTSSVSAAVADGWVRIASCTSAAGRGGCRIYVSHTGGSGAPDAMVLELSTSWDAKPATLRVLSNPGGTGITDVRVGYVSPAQYVNIKVSQASAQTYRIRVVQDLILSGQWVADGVNPESETFTDEYEFDVSTNNLYWGIFTADNVGARTYLDSNGLTHENDDADATLWLKGDTTNTVESGNAVIVFEQDGGAVQTVMGGVGATDEDARGNTVTDAVNNSWLVHSRWSDSSNELGFALLGQKYLAVQQEQLWSHKPILANTSQGATGGSTFLQGYYTDTEVLNTWGAEYSSGATAMCFGVRPNEGASGWLSTTDNDTYHSALTIGAAGLTWESKSASVVAIDAAATLTEILQVNQNGRVTANQYVATQDTTTNTWGFRAESSNNPANDSGLYARSNNWGLILRDSGGTIACEWRTDGTASNHQGDIDCQGFIDAAGGFVSARTASGVTNAFSAIGTLPAFYIQETDAAASNQGWKLYALSGDLAWWTTSDTGSVTNKIIEFQRTGTTVDRIQTYADTYLASDTTGHFETHTGNYGSVQATGWEGTSGLYSGFSISGRQVFMHNDNTQGGIYNDVNNEWLIVLTHNSASTMYYNGGSRFLTTSAGARVNHRLYFDEQSAAGGDVAGDGQIWVKDDAPNQLMFTDDAGTDSYVGLAEYKMNIVNQNFNFNTTGNGEDIVNGMIRYTNSTAYTITLSDSTNTEFPVGGRIDVYNRGTNTITVSEGSSMTLYYLDGASSTDTAGGCTIAAGGYASIIKESTTVWVIMGGGITA
jgi:hypothetical protein